MSDIRFYHLQFQAQQQALPLLITKAYEQGHRIVVKLRDVAEVNQFNDHLWSFHPDSFLPHGCAKDGNAENQPIWITHEDENPNKADVLILGQGAASEQVSDYKLCCIMLNGQDEQSIAQGRGLWKQYKGEGHDITYWQQTERGGWDKKA